MDRQRLFGREIEVEFARGDRKSKKNVNLNIAISFFLILSYSELYKFSFQNKQNQKLID